MSKTYIIASSKPWHKPSFDEVAAKKDGQWYYVSNQEELDAVLEKVEPRFIFFLHWNWIVPESVWKKHESICFHMTDVPYGRGGSPLQNLILSGKKETKVTALQMVKKMDAGPVYMKRAMQLNGRAEEIYLRAGAICWEMIEEIILHEPSPVPQTGEEVKFRRRTPDQSNLPKDGELSNIYDFIRMLDAPTYPLAFLEHGFFRMEFSHAEMREDEIIAKVIIKKGQELY